MLAVNDNLNTTNYYINNLIIIEIINNSAILEAKGGGLPGAT